MGLPRRDSAFRIAKPDRRGCRRQHNPRNLRLMMDAFLFLMLNTHITQTNRLIESNQGPPNPPRGQEDSGRQGLPCLRITIIG